MVMVELGGIRLWKMMGAANVHREIDNVITPEIVDDPFTLNPRLVPAINVQLRNVKVIVVPAAIPTKSTVTIKLLKVVAAPLITNVL